ncbi:MAG: class I SAM-dependent methyltransferase [Candidatus Sulfotelmatobacter sp.]
MKDQYSVAELLKIADARLYPSLTNPSYLVQRGRRRILGKWLESIPGDRLTVLDIGGRYQPYRPLIQHRLQRYVALDILSTPLVDVLGKGEQLPFKSDTFDLVLATGVFEYFPEPRVVAAQIHRVLKPGGHLMLSVASVYPRVVEEEHWRYLPAGLKFALGPFFKIEIVPEVTSIGGALRLNAAAISIFAKYGFVRQVLHHTVVPVLNMAGLALESARLSTNDQLAGNYCALAQK